MHRLVSPFILDQYIAGADHGDLTAACLFVDIAGFSTLTRTLMGHGQHGAEVLATIMRSFYGPLVAAVYGQDGFITVFAGDAFTALLPAIETELETGLSAAVASVAEVSVDEETKRIRVHHITSAMDCGLVVNPDGVKAQMEGNAMWGVSATLQEEVRIENGRVALNNFDTYPLLTMKEAPVVETILVDTGGQEPTGVGEPPIGPIGPAIANAVFALTGQRLRQMPLKLA